MTHFVATKVGQEVECMPSKCEVMNAQPITTKTNKKEKEKEMAHHMEWLRLAKNDALPMKLLFI
jgi:hypothetical protein